MQQGQQAAPAAAPMAKTLPGIFIVETAFGITVREIDGNIRFAKSAAMTEFGTRGFREVREATVDELVEIKRAGGWMPVHVRATVEAREREVYRKG